MEYQHSDRAFLRRAWAEIHLDRIEHNVLEYKKLMDTGSELCCVVKADAYGHCDEAVAPFLQNNLGVKWFAVSNLNEGERLRSFGITGEILILGYTPPEEAEAIAELNIIQTVTGCDYARELSDNLSGERELRVHVAVDSGMTRIGLRNTDAEKIAEECEQISNLNGIKLEGMFTHLCVADSDEQSDILYTDRQLERFEEAVQATRRRGLRIEQSHYLNSAGGAYRPNSHSTLSRLGIMMYGLYPNAKLEVPCKLLPAMELKARVAQVKEVEAGVDVSYGRTFTTTRLTKICTLTIGYADGYSRLLSNIGEVLINGKRAKVIGRVCMDQMMVDATGIEVKSGDIAEVFGANLTADEVAQNYNSIGYEVVCGITSRVPRVVMYGGEIKKIYY